MCNFSIILKIFVILWITNKDNLINFIIRSFEKLCTVYKIWNYFLLDSIFHPNCELLTEEYHNAPTCVGLICTGVGKTMKYSK